MADVKWIKLATDIFDNRKIKQIEKMPEGDSIIVVWLKLLCLAGNVNENGYLYMTKEIPYTEQMLASHFNTPLNIVQLALNTFITFGMIEVVDDVLYVSSWEKYQNTDGLERIREQNRLRQARFKEKKKLLLANVSDNVSDNAKITQGNETEEESDSEKESEKDIVPPLSPKKETAFENPFVGELHDALDEWISYKKEKRQPYKPQGLKSLITQIRNNAEKHGDAAVAGIIRDSMASNYQGIVFDRLEKSAGKKQQRGTKANVQDYEGSRDFFDD